MTRDEFLELGTDVFSEYLPKIKSSDRKTFLNALLDELVARDEIEANEADDAESAHDFIDE